MYYSNNVVKASFKDCDISDRKKFHLAKCIMPISVGQDVHEGKKLQATFALVNKSFKSCTILLDDSIQRYTLKIEHNDKTDDDLYAIAIKAGDAWLIRNKKIYEALTIPYNIMRWDAWLNKQSYAEQQELVNSLYNNNANYQAAIDNNIQSFLTRYTQRNSQHNFDYTTAFALCLDYLKEECAVMCLWCQDKYDFEVYPSGRNQAMTATYDYLIKPTYPNLLKSVGIRFKKHLVKDKEFFNSTHVEQNILEL